PIFYAVVQNDVGITKLLIEYKANPNYQDYIGNTIIHYAIIDAHTEILYIIMTNYAIRGKVTSTYSEDINNKHDTNGDSIDPNIVNIDGLIITHLFLYNYKSDYDEYIRRIIPKANL